MNTQQNFEQWIDQLIAITADETKLNREEIKVNAVAAKPWYDAGLSPYMVFRDTWNMED